jgi:Glycerol-3-phosphate acyltransferase C-terminal region
MYLRVKRGGGKDNQSISFEELRGQVLFLSQLFRGEFIYPTEGLAANLENTLRGLEADKVIELARDSGGKIMTVGLSDIERVAGRENYDFYCFLIWPFIEASWLGAVSLMGLTPALNSTGDGWLDVTKVQNSAQLVSFTAMLHEICIDSSQLGKTLYHQGDLSYFEAVNKETLKNAYQRFEEEGILLVAKSRQAKAVPKLKLAPDWIPRRDPENGQIIAEGRLWDFTEKIAQSRREGKNRRDGATVSTRVLRLSDKIGQDLFAAANGNAKLSEEEDTLVNKRKARRKNMQTLAHL